MSLPCGLVSLLKAEYYEFPNYPPTSTVGTFPILCATDGERGINVFIEEKELNNWLQEQVEGPDRLALERQLGEVLRRVPPLQGRPHPLEDGDEELAAVRKEEAI